MKTLLILSVLFTQVTFAQTVIDKNNLLGQIDQFLNARSFEDEFVVDDYIEATNTHCTIITDSNGDTSRDCFSNIEESKIIEVGSNWALMSDGLAFIKDLYERYDRNPVRYFLREQAQTVFDIVGEKSISDDFSYKLTKLIPTTYMGFAALKLELTIEYNLDDGTSLTFPLYLKIARDLPFMGQIAEAGLMMDINGEMLPPSYQVTNFIKY